MAGTTKIKTDKETKVDKKLKEYLPFFVWLVVLALVFFVFYFAFQGLGKVTYQGLTFVKEKYGDIPIYRYSYLTKLPDGNVRNIQVLLRGNPAENNVPISGDIAYPSGKSVYLSLNATGLNQCNMSIIGISEFSIFLTNNDIPLKSGTPDKAEADAKNATYLNCQTHNDSMTISLRAGSETKITKNGLCYDMEVSNCEVVPAFEKFIVQSIIDARKAAN